MTQDKLKDLEYLIEKSKTLHMSEEQITAQRRSFAYGNSAFENQKITREIVEAEAAELGL